MKVVFTPEAERDIERLAYIRFVSDQLKLRYDKIYYEVDIYCIQSNNKWGIADFDGNELIPPRYDWLGDDFYDRYSDYKGYIKVVRNYKDEKYYIAIYNDKYGMAEVSQKDLRKNKVSIKEELITEVPQNTIVCHKN